MWIISKSKKLWCSGWVKILSLWVIWVFLDSIPGWVTFTKYGSDHLGFVTKLDPTLGTICILLKTRLLVIF